DFGIAKALGEGNDIKTRTGTLRGKFGYMAPEQVELGQSDHRADLFSAGVLLHELLSGRRLFKGGTDLETLALVRAALVDRPSLANPAVPRELDAICLKMLAREPADRFQSGEALATALHELVQHFQWGPEPTAAMLRALPGSRDRAGDAASQPETAATTLGASARAFDRRARTISAAAPPRRGRKKRWLLPLALGVVVAGALAWL